MINTDLKPLEFDSFKQILLDNVSSRFASHSVSMLQPYSDADDIEHRQALIQECIRLQSFNSFDLPHDEDYFNLIPKLDDPLAAYEPMDFVCFMNFHKSLAALKRLILGTDVSEDMRSYFSHISTFKVLVEDIDRKISPEGRIKDRASSDLNRVRKGLHQSHGAINKSLHKILNQNQSDKYIQERIITVRNNRYTLMCKPNYKQYISGIVHDMSDSGQTYYVEPTSIVEVNNHFQQLKIEESTEIARILRAMVAQVISEKELILSTAEAYQIIIFHMEMAKFYARFDHCFPVISDRLRFESVHHPLILFHKQSESVPINLTIPAEVKLVVVTGPNTGGKTAALKSVGLNTLVAKCGLPLFGKKAEMVMFDHISADIGDQQSIMMDLSTFSAHMLNLKQIVESVSPNSLVLCDELGTGTEPKEGACLAVSILEYLMGKGAKAMVTTHFSEVKLFVRNHPEAMMLAVDFDYERFQPSYQLLEGVEGKSDPLLIARKLELNDDIVQRAEALIHENTSDMEMSWQDINELKASLVSKVDDAEARLQSIKEKEIDINEKEKNITEKLNKKEIELLEETYALLNRAKSLAKKSASALKKDSVNGDLQQAGKKLDALKQQRKTIQDVQVGDVLHLEKYGKQAKVLRVEKNAVFVDMEGMKVSISNKELIGHKAEEVKKKKVNVRDKVTRQRKAEIVIIGKTVEEAEDILDKYLDEQMLAGVDFVAVVHGRGSGALKKGVHQYLKNDSRVVSFKLAELNEGGPAITIVKI